MVIIHNVDNMAYQIIILSDHTEIVWSDHKYSHTKPYPFIHTQTHIILDAKGVISMKR